GISAMLAGEGAGMNRLRQWLRKDGAPRLAGVAVALALLAAQVIGIGPVDRLGLLLFDAYACAAPRDWQDAPVRVVDIDDESLRRLGQWPWPRTEIARLTDALGAAGASAIAFDIVFAEPDRTSPAALAERLGRDGADPSAIAALARLPDNDAVLAQAFARNPVVAGAFLLNDRAGAPLPPKAGFGVAGTEPSSVPAFRRAIASLPAIHEAAAGSGFVSLAGGADGIVREVPLLARQGGGLLPSLSLEALRVAQGAGSITLRTSDAGSEGGSVPGQAVAVKVGQFEVPVTASGALWLHPTASREERIIPAWRILSGELSGAALEQAVAGRIVLVGAGAIGLRDLVATPLAARELGVVVHAQAIEQMVLGQFKQRPDWAAGLERALVLAGGIGLALLLPALGALRGAAVGLGMVGAMAAASWWAYVERGFLLDPVWPVLALVLVYLVSTAITFYREERRRAYIHGAFDRYLSPELVRRIAADPGRLELGGEEREMSVLFCDIRGFSRISESMGPKELIRFLIGFLTPMCDVLLARKATLDKFIGDAILAFWNAPLDDPDHHRNAALAALDMARALEAMNADPALRPADVAWPAPVRIGIGLNCGLCCVGNMGSRQRLSYSLLGDTVNLASRLEGLTKHYGGTIAIGSALAARLDGFALLGLDRVRVVGRDAPET
ncbi:MAG TPA: adenylate/guanylate cyclase domain-containing protein, partial [Novosphingobium sp.]|nr:adenylate/guanylate cyclase domain-containing protein [Novosphingobium sp.]